MEIKNRVFSKIWIIGILAVVLASGILAWQKLGVSNKEVKPLQSIQNETAGRGTYRNEGSGFEFKYPVEAEFMGETQAGVAIINLPFASGTLLQEKYLVVSDSGIKNCSISRKANIRNSETVTINYIVFLKETSEEGAAGSFYDSTEYSTVKDDSCIRLVFILRSASPGVFDTPPPNFNREEEIAIYDQILSTFKFIEKKDWKMYTNTIFGYQVGYPSGFEVKPQTKREKSQLGEGQNICIAKIGKNSCKLIINTFELNRYKLIDNSGGFTFKYDADKKQWVHDKTNETSQFAPQRANASLEAYFYGTGDMKCSSKYILLPNIFSNHLIEIINATCRDDDGNIVEGYEDISSDSILFTFKFLK